MPLPGRSILRRKTPDDKAGGRVLKLPPKLPGVRVSRSSGSGLRGCRAVVHPHARASAQVSFAEPTPAPRAERLAEAGEGAQLVEVAHAAAAVVAHAQLSAIATPPTPPSTPAEGRGARLAWARSCSGAAASPPMSPTGFFIRARARPTPSHNWVTSGYLDAITQIIEHREREADELPPPKARRPRRFLARGSWSERLQHSLGDPHHSRTLALLALIGLASSSLALVVRVGTVLVHSAVDAAGARSAPVWVGAHALLGLAATAVPFTLSKHATGSGIPEIRAILSGVHLHRYLSARTLCTKLLALVLARAARLSIGIEGPLVHLTACAASALLGTRAFGSIGAQPAARKAILAAASAAGVVATFGTPVGGVLFSIEVTATHYLVPSLWGGFFCALCTVGLFQLTGASRHLSLAPRAPLVAAGADAAQLGTARGARLVCARFALAAAVGVCMGLCAALFVAAFRRLATTVTRLRLGKPPARFILVPAVACACALGTLGLAPLRAPTEALLRDLFDGAEGAAVAGEAGLPPVGSAARLPILLALLCAKLALTCVSLVLPVASGCFSPICAIGALLGRAAGELLQRAAPAVLAAADASPALIAVLCTAGIASATTGTLSTALVIAEALGQQPLLPLALTTVVVANGVASLLSLSLYDQILVLKKLPFMPHLETDALHALSAAEAMRHARHLPVIHRHMSWARCAEVLAAHPRDSVLALVDSARGGQLVATVRRKALLLAAPDELAVTYPQLSACCATPTAPRFPSPRNAVLRALGTPPACAAAEDGASMAGMSGTSSAAPSARLSAASAASTGHGWWRALCAGDAASVADDTPRASRCSSASASACASASCTPVTRRSRSASTSSSDEAVRESMRAHACMHSPGTPCGSPAAYVQLVDDDAGVGGSVDGEHDAHTNAEREHSGRASPTCSCHDAERAGCAQCATAHPVSLDASPTPPGQAVEGVASQLSRVPDWESIELDGAPLQVTHVAPLRDVHALFLLLAPTHVWVTTQGRLRGVITLHELVEACTERRRQGRAKPKAPLAAAVADGSSSGAAMS